MRFAVTAHLANGPLNTTAQLKVGGENLVIESQSVSGALQKLNLPLQDFEISLAHGIVLEGITLERIDPYDREMS
jgi:hypothetical protein